ncbi:MAG: SDR family oxidoreductase [Chloroflexota bacterium]
MKKRVMITGARGLLGLNLALQAAEKYEVVGIDKLDTLRPTSFEALQADLLSPGVVAELLERVQPDWVIHCAALADMDVCEAQPELAQRLNAALPGEIAAETGKHGIRMVHISTDAVFDGTKGDYRENDIPSPRSVYAQTKLDGEQAVLASSDQAIVARVNFYGWSASGTRSLAEFFFNNLTANKPINGFDNVFVCPLQVNQLGEILLEMLERDLAGLYHVMSSQSISKYEFGVALAEKFGLDAGLITPIPIEQAGLKAERSPNLTINTEKLAAALGKPLPQIDSGLNRLYKLYQDGYRERLKNQVAQ